MWEMQILTHITSPSKAFSHSMLSEKLHMQCKWKIVDIQIIRLYTALFNSHFLMFKTFLSATSSLQRKAFET